MNVYIDLYKYCSLIYRDEQIIMNERASPARREDLLGMAWVQYLFMKMYDQFTREGLIKIENIPEPEKRELFETAKKYGAKKHNAKTISIMLYILKSTI